MTAAARSLLCLFDIDGTLVHVAEELAFARAFREQCGADVDLSFRPGRVVSDSAYIGDVLQRFHGRDPVADEVTMLIARFVELLDALCEAGEAPVRALAGAAPFLDRLAARAALAVSTGCVEPSARWKLRRAGLDRAFPCGGFSHREQSRAEIVRRAIAAAEQCYATRFERVVLFGDGPWDLTSAREAGVGFIGINEHESGRARLRDLGARHVFADYGDAQAILASVAEAAVP
jgi:phosphoglycolate phosphatase-like HAD superfamily hydrolase